LSQCADRSRRGDVLTDMSDRSMRTAGTPPRLHPMTALVLAVAATCAVGASPAPAASCRAPDGATAMHRSASAIVYRRTRPSFQGTANYWACLRASGRRTTLPGSTAQHRPSSFRSAGRFLAFVVEENNFHNGTASIGIRVFDLRAGKPVRGIVLPSSPPDDPDRMRFSNLILTATGAAAWRQTGRIDRIGARDVRGNHVVLASGPRGSIRDLVLIDGTTARWRNGGGLQSRRLDRLGR